MKQVTIPAQWLQELIALCGPEDHELRERVMKSVAPATADSLATATGLPAQAVPLKLIEAINTACGGNEWQGDAQAPDLLEPACRAIASLVPQAQADARDAESDYQRGYRHGYNRRDAEVQGALL